MCFFFFFVVNPHIKHNWANKLMHVKLAMTTSIKVNLFFWNGYVDLLIRKVECA
jgi:hypothetical protein